MPESQEITITYETLFELLRNEKNREELQKLYARFYDDVANYLKEKIEFIEKTRNSLFSTETIREKELELANIKKLINDLYSRRERKIIQLAIDKSKTKSSLIDTSHLLEEEKVFFDGIVEILDKNRELTLGILFEGKKPEFAEKIMLKESMQTETKEDVQLATNEYSQPDKSTKMIRFLDSVPRFVGPELEEYGPFQKEDIANLPQEIADVLIDKGRAEVVEDN